MASVLRRFLKVPPREPLLELEADWSAVSPAGLGLLFKELLADFMGAPPPPEVLEAREFYKRAWKTANIADIYFRNRHIFSATNPGFLVRGIIYDMPSLIYRDHKAPTNTSESMLASSTSSSTSSSTAEPVEKYDVKRRDWSSLLLDFDTVEAKNNTKADDTAVSADQVMESLGLKAVVPGLKDRVGITLPGRKEMKPRSKMEEKQALEEVMGRGDSIRAKYAAKIFQKKMLAEARREQAKLGIFLTASPRASSKGWQAMPGAPALVRYMEERGLKQALLARGSEEDLTCLLDQLGNYQFQHITHLSSGSSEMAFGETLSNEQLKRVCTNWALPPKQVMVVIGSGAPGKAALAATEDSGFFVCQVNNSPHEDKQEQNITETLGTNAKSSVQKKGLVSWFNQLKEGTLHVDEDNDSRMRHLFPKGHIHFSVTDMVELKWVIEDLNGVSYRKSTLISGFQDLGQGAKQL
ncbi:uncharacterized protein [Physcomitrium patens]|uniref:Ig-like domain-containing protein n=2 Tax=Physcomitrium patens TaxID=3218 RepID=A0A2K1L8X4_PHYPA|nr:uncharacterized protein LOC112283460 [Physcomitrium patens]PNR62462.1 hypothetical protein PHYPA_000886 [Physcomitrium patens]|eukprot:XP_024377896.1 uncharacterized protein LOC112283460 [Physcomitrella patens]